MRNLTQMTENKLKEPLQTETIYRGFTLYDYTETQPDLEPNRPNYRRQNHSFSAKRAAYSMLEAIGRRTVCYSNIRYSFDDAPFGAWAFAFSSCA
jgi:hypothetical protein